MKIIELGDLERNRSSGDLLGCGGRWKKDARKDLRWSIYAVQRLCRGAALGSRTPDLRITRDPDNDD
jgi:hypothetical protein